MINNVEIAWCRSSPSLLIDYTQGIAPTIIAVRVSLGVESVDTLVAPTPRTRVVSQFPAARHLDDILYIRPISVKVETVFPLPLGKRFRAPYFQALQ
jgi:hypothetical protein